MRPQKCKGSRNRHSGGDRHQLQPLALKWVTKIAGVVDKVARASHLKRKSARLALLNES